MKLVAIHIVLGLKWYMERMSLVSVMGDMELEQRQPKLWDVSNNICNRRLQRGNVFDNFQLAVS